MPYNPEYSALSTLPRLHCPDYAVLSTLSSFAESPNSPSKAALYLS